MRTCICSKFQFSCLACTITVSLLILANLLAPLHAAPPSPAKPADPLRKPPTVEVPPINLKAMDLSLLEALEIVCKLGNLEYRIEGPFVVVKPRKTPVAK